MIFPKKVPWMPSISGIDLLAYGGQCHFAPVGPPCPAIFLASLCTIYQIAINFSALLHMKNSRIFCLRYPYCQA